MYKTEVIQVKIGKEVYKIHQVTNVDEVFERLIHADPHSIDVRDERIPYWTELWPAAIAMGDFLSSNPSLVNGKRVAEIASGLGLPAIVVGSLCSEVMVSDYIEDAVSFAKKNWGENHLHRAQFDVLDWRELHLDPWPDVILASDIAYEKRFQDLLPSAIVEWCEKGAVVVFSEPSRKTAADFMEELKKMNYCITEDNITVEWRGVVTKVNILVFQK